MPLCVLAVAKRGSLPSLYWPAIPLGKPNTQLGRRLANRLGCWRCCTSVSCWYPRSIQLRGRGIDAYVLGLGSIPASY
jgi:hypothetical protein